jgi:tRNA(Ile)-lysidine synthase
VLQDFRDGHRRWRPLIAAGIAKSTLLAELRAAGIPWREDATNGLPIAARNRIRAWLADGGEAALGAGYAEGFTRSARIIGEAQAALVCWARELGCVVSAAGTMPVGALKDRPEALAQECLREFLHRHGVADAGAKSLLPLTSAIVTGSDAQSAVRGVVVRLQAGELSVQTVAPAFGPAERRLLMGSPDDECALLAEIVDVDATLWASLSNGDISPTKEVYLVAPVSALAWRGRMEGDRYQPLGSSGSAKLSDLLINRKIPAERREALPVVLAGSEILWVPGLPPTESARLAGPTKGALRLTWLGLCLG